MSGTSAEFQVPDGHTLTLIGLHGTFEVNHQTIVRAGQLLTFERAGERFVVEANADAKFLVLGGAPIEEPVVGYGPFVMNSDAEIRQAINDFNSGRFGRLRPTAVERVDSPQRSDTSAA
jgi:redox-sensitive bicupin YhaK (pirin superfamily)